MSSFTVGCMRRRARITHRRTFVPVCTTESVASQESRDHGKHHNVESPAVLLPHYDVITALPVTLQGASKLLMSSWKL